MIVNLELHSENSERRAYRLSREQYSHFELKNITFKENKLPMLFLNCFIVFFLVLRNSSNKRRIGDAALIRGRRLLTFLSQMRRLFEGGAYSSKYGILFISVLYSAKLKQSEAKQITFVHCSNPVFYFFPPCIQRNFKTDIFV